MSHSVPGSSPSIRPARRVLAVAQTTPVRGDVAANTEQHLRLAELAARERPDVLLFPELSLTGYEIDVGRELAFSPGDARLPPLLDAARVHEMTIVAGAPWWREARLHIAALVISPDGAVDVYTKHRLGAFSSRAACDGEVPPAEATVFDPGDVNPLVALPGGERAAIAVCADIGRPGHVGNAVARGATVLLASMFAIRSDISDESAKLAAFAREYRIAVAFANFGSPSGGLAAAGRSAIWNEQGMVIAELPATGAGVAIAKDDGDGWSSRSMPLRP